MNACSADIEGIPKPVTLPNAFLCSYDMHRLIPNVNGLQATGCYTYGDSGTMFFMMFPNFHLGGLDISLCPVFTGSTMVMGPPDVPANASIVLKIMERFELSAIISPPSILNDLVSAYR